MKLTRHFCQKAIGKSAVVCR